MISKDYTLKIGDFGISHLQKSFQKFHSNSGTPFYTAPEIFMKSGFDQKIDVWSLGCILYQMCTFNTPFTSVNLEVLKS